MKICICGGGNLGHVVAGFVAAQSQYEVCVLTRQLERWSKELTIEAPEDTTYVGKLSGIYSDARHAVSDADIILLCLPGYGIRDTLIQIKDYLKADAAVGSVVSSTGFFFQAMELLPKTQRLFGFQRVPFISRIVEYGHRARLMGYKDCLELAIEQSDNPESLRQVLQQMLRTPIHLLRSHYEVSLSNSNPLLHPSRLYSLWKDWHEGIVYDRVPLFYEEWTEEAAQLYISMDNELQSLLEQLPVSKGSIATVLDYYESTDVPSLARKLRSIEAFKGIAAPMKAVEGGFVPDFHSRYFTEDFPYGLAFVHRLAHEKGVPSPTIDMIYDWGMKWVNG
ncbi:MAG: NAD/NADP octopine/nopaline dehydrogenase family protein [Bacteroidaceae bacterium]|nr:NAD/NADP octopine/nopaline dehydrogenase family protein [Bacteroidaceae bacterium]